MLFVAVGALAGLFGTAPLFERFLSDGSSSSDAAPEGEGAGRIVEVETEPTEQHAFSDTISAVGTVAARQAIDIVPTGEGRVAEIRFEDGEEVDAGAVLLILDDRAERAALKEAQATLAEAESSFRRIENLNERDVSSEAEIETARATFLRAEAAVQLAESDLDDRRLVAPFSGVLGISDIDVGERIAAGTVVTTLDDISVVSVAFSVPEQYRNDIQPGQRVLLRSDALGSGAMEGAVEVVGPRVEEASRAFEIRAEVENEQRLLAAGMFVDVELILEQRRSAAVPEDAIISEGEESYVFVVQDDKAVRQGVRTGALSKGTVEIVDGLQPGDPVITAGYETLNDGDGVRIAETEAAENGE